jgi:phenylacetate-CoA ligase
MNKFIYSREKEFAPLSAIRVMQEKLLTEHLRYCLSHSPYYRKILSGKDLNADSFSILNSLPTTDKNILAKNPDGFTAVANSEVQDIVFSSGTTGKPLPIVYTREDLERLAYNELKSFLGCGMNKEDRVLLTCTIDRCFVAGLAYFEGVRAVGAATIRNGLNTLESHTEIIRQLNPTAVVGVPSFLKRLGMHLKKMHIFPESVRMLICIGEPVRNQELTLNPLGENLEQLWGAKVFSTYASSEVVTSFCECEAGCGGHLHPDLAILEILDDNGNSLPPLEAGEVTITPLQMRGMPLLRFRTGDISFRIETPCPCGRNSMRLGPILGRKQQMMKISGTTFYPQAVFTALESMNGIIDYYLLAYQKNGFNHNAEVHVAISDEKQDSATIARQLAAITRIKLKVVIEPIETIHGKIFSMNSRKPVRFFVTDEDIEYGQD